ncbi:bifunctional diguanylate cyclase/phosphodiesterase [Janthinobacterium sp. CG3]|uniref:bifunctional diguanylate cyclase/phosphodiesterase n=1 Tax=Janthinobacterium sp. CG3 TaxID=1075768 RepID=UPI00034BC89D|nr:EAL domain-containing protein [Janthinobacterium sp. CG3]
MDKLFRRVRVSVSVSALITLAVGLGLTALLFASVRKVESHTRALEFQQAAKLRSNAVAGGLADAVEQLTVLNQLFRSVDPVSREQFRSFTAPLLQRYPEIQALSFQRLVRHQDRAAFERAMRRRFPDFQINELADGRLRRAGVRDSYNVVDYLEPPAGNVAAFGLDTAVAREQGEARERSRASGRPAATGLLSLAQQQGWHTGFLVLAPVYLRGAPLDTAAARRRAVVGETAAMFRVDRLIHTLLGAGGLLDAPGVSVDVYAAAGADRRQLAFRHGDAGAAGAGWPLPRWLWLDQGAPQGTSFDVAGQPWYVEVARAPAHITDGRHGSLYALLGGILSSLFAAAHVYTLVSRNGTIERVAGARTAALQFANLRLSEDLAVRASNERALRLREKAIEVSANAIVICGAAAPDYPIEYVNPAFERITGYSAAEVLGRNIECLQGRVADQQNLEEVRAALRERREGHALLRNYRKDGGSYWSDLFIAPVREEGGDAVSHFVVAQYDVTAVMRFEAELEFQAKHDTLTGLANRNLLRERLGQAIAAAEQDGNPLWVVFVDLDRFKIVNDTLGHEAGDALLTTLAGRLQAATRDADTVARLGGDEFVLVLPQYSDERAGLAVLERIMDAVAQPLYLERHEFFLTCSIGVAIYPADGASAEALTKHADIAMYRAKELGRNNFQFYTAAMNQRTLERLSLEGDLRHALERGEFELHYQPQLALHSGRVVGMEALLRWNHPRLGQIAPGLFIGMAEEMGLIIPIGAWVMRTACAQTRAWQLAGLGELRVAVNLSARQFTQKGLLQSIADVLGETGLEARLLDLELTESMVMNDVDQAIAILRNLKGLGVHVAIDDFGTGYSSLSYLRRFPIDVLKIDQSFVNDIANDAEGAAIVLSIISLAHSLRLSVVAEGVETAEQLDYLRAHGCEQMQGYYFSRPLPAAAFEQLLREGRGLPSLACA